MLRLAEESDLIPDVGIDGSLVKYSGLNSAAELENSIKDMISKIPDFIQSLGCAIASFDAVSNAVGLGAVALAIALELLLMTQQESEDSTLDMVRRVFAEEKASGVRDLMEEYLKRLRMYLHQPSQALEETERLEKQLSEQLTRLKNSMLHDNQMSSRSMKHWSNGAAFHLQMLIHAARLKLQSTKEDKKLHLQVHLDSINPVLDIYQHDLDDLLKQYKTYKKSTISLTRPVSWIPTDPVTPNLVSSWIVKDTELERETSEVVADHKMAHCLFDRPHLNLPSYVDYMFDNWTQLKELESYFSDLKEQINDLIIQNNEFNLQKLLPVSDRQDV